MAFERVCGLAEIPERGGTRVTVRGRLIGLWRVGTRVYAMDDVCPHAASPLSAGDLEGTRVVCPGHAWEFDLVTGLAPGEVDEEPLERFPVRIDGDDVFVDPDAPIGRGGTSRGAPS